MEHATLVRELYRACLQRDPEKQRELLVQEFANVFERRGKGQGFDVSWTVIRG